MYLRKENLYKNNNISRYKLFNDFDNSLRFNFSEINCYSRAIFCFNFFSLLTTIFGNFCVMIKREKNA